MEFIRQQSSLFVQKYGNRSLHHTYWQNFEDMHQKDAANLSVIEPWMQQNVNGYQIISAGIHPELLLGIQNYGAILQGLINCVPMIFQKTAVAAVIYDSFSDKLYYGISGFVPSMQTMKINPILDQRIQQLPTNVNGVRTQVGNRVPNTCSEFKSLNRA